MYKVKSRGVEHKIEVGDLIMVVNRNVLVKKGGQWVKFSLKESDKIKANIKLEFSHHLAITSVYKSVGLKK